MVCDSSYSPWCILLNVLHFYLLIGCLGVSGACGLVLFWLNCKGAYWLVIISSPNMWCSGDFKYPSSIFMRWVVNILYDNTMTVLVLLPWSWCCCTFYWSFQGLYISNISLSICFVRLGELWWCYWFISIVNFLFWCYKHHCKNFLITTGCSIIMVVHSIFLFSCPIFVPVGILHVLISWCINLKVWIW